MVGCDRPLGVIDDTAGFLVEEWSEGSAGEDVIEALAKKMQKDADSYVGHFKPFKMKCEMVQKEKEKEHQVQERI